MARIRSVHPGLFTDESFVSLSAFARLLIIGVWTECDDHGVFEWKPISIKMRIFPADNVDVGPLLEELAAANIVDRFESAGRKFGVVRNFRRYQRPKSPTYRHPFPDEFGIYIGLSDGPSEDLPHTFPSATEIAPQMKDGGGRMEEEGDKESDSGNGARSESSADFVEWYSAYPKHEARGKAEKAYVQARKKASKAQLLTGAQKARIKYKNSEKKFIPLPASWLNAERWTDDFSTEPDNPDDGGGGLRETGRDQCGRPDYRM